MYDVMNGVRVVEVADYTFVPAAGMALADWGADVIKVERTGGGDAIRNMALPGTDGTAALNPYFEVGNRGKRSVVLDLRQEAGRQQLYRLIDGADVFLTSLRADSRRKLGIEPAELMARNPRLVYARGTGYGPRGPMADDPAFDYPSAWCRAGAAHAQTLPGGEPPKPPASVGDLTGGITLAGAIAAALFRRERTGKGSVVDNALYMVGTYLMSQSLAAQSIGLPIPLAVHAQADAGMALANNYRTRDGRWISLCILLEGWWPDFARHVGREDLLSDPRFADGRARNANARALVQELNVTFAARDYADWCERLATLEGVWAPIQNAAEVLKDAQALENGFVSRVEVDAERSYQIGVTPAQFDDLPIGALRGSPAYGQHTVEVLRELGLDEEAIAGLRAAAAIG